MKLNLLAAIAFAVASAASASASSVSVYINNASFGLPDVGSSGGFSSNAVTGWTGTNTYGVYDPPSGFVEYNATGQAQADAGDGQVAYLSGTGVSSTLSQLLFTEISPTPYYLLPNTTYSLTVLVGQRSDFGDQGSDYAVGLYAGGGLLSQKTNADIATVPGEFKTVTVTYTSPSVVGANQQLSIKLTGSTVNNAQHQFNDVALSYDEAVIQAAPLPSTFATSAAILSLTGLGAFVFSRRASRSPAAL